MIKFTVVEANNLLTALSGESDLKKEYTVFKTITRLFRIAFFIFAALRTLFVFTVLVALFKNNNDLAYIWNSGYGFIGLFLYIIASMLDFLRLLDIGIFIAVIVGLFQIGNGFWGNFVSFALPIVLAYAIVFFLVVGCNFLFNAITEKVCPKIYHMISEYMEYIGVNKSSNKPLREPARNNTKKAHVDRNTSEKKEKSEDDEDEEDF